MGYVGFLGEMGSILKKLKTQSLENAGVKCPQSSQPILVGPKKGFAVLVSGDPSPMGRNLRRQALVIDDLLKTRKK
jgi:hypothetical protein